ncbi:MAG: hypothetical protein ACRDZS_13570, partial [Acidimicrobiales bacterium]
FCINQLDVVLGGEADAIVWIKAPVTYLVPFCVSCAGVLVGTRCYPTQRGRATRRLARTSATRVTPRDHGRVRASQAVRGSLRGPAAEVATMTPFDPAHESLRHWSVVAPA